MKIAILALFVTASVFAQAQVGRIASACGPYDVSFKVKPDEKDHSPAQATGKALVYFIHDSGTSAVIAYPTTKMGVDGAWAGANHSNSYFYVSVEPGEHHVCADLQTSLRGPHGVVAFGRTGQAVLLPHTMGDVSVGGVAGA